MESEQVLNKSASKHNKESSSTSVVESKEKLSVQSLMAHLPMKMHDEKSMNPPFMKKKRGTMSILFPCITGDYGCGENLNDERNKISDDCEENDKIVQQTILSKDEKSHDNERLLKQVSSWMSAMSREVSFNTVPEQPGASVRSPASPPRLRNVKFDKVPITSVKCVPKHSKDELQRLFFSQKELDQWEEDREFPIGDIEIVIKDSCPKSTPTRLPSKNSIEDDGSPKSVSAVMDNLAIMAKNIC